MPWADQILRIDLSNRRYWTEDTEPYKRQFIGGKGINVKIMFDEVGPTVGPFDEDNRLCFGPGALTGTMAPTHSRAKLTSVSPNGLMNNSGIGGHLPAEIKMAGYDNLIIQGKSEEPVYIYVNDDKVEFRPAGHILGQDTQETQRTIKSELGETVKVCCIGPAGEKLQSFSCIVHGIGSAAGRNGFGAVMGAKNLKAIAIRGSKQPRSRSSQFASYCQEVYKWMPESCDLMKLQHKGGHWDKYSLDFFSDKGVAVIPLGNFTDYGSFAELGEDEGAEEFYDDCATHQYGCFGCPAHHFHIFNVPGRVLGTTKCTQWESFTSFVWNRNRRLMVHANTLCQHYGLDSTGTVNAVAFLMDLYHRGIITEKETDGVPMKRGDEKAILTVVHKIGQQEGFGRLFKDGVLGAARQIGGGAEDFAFHVNGQEMEPFEVRPYKSWALCAATTDGSVSHGETYVDLNWILAPEEMEKLAKELYGSKKAAQPTVYDYKALIVFVQENRKTAGDLIGACKWVWPWGIRSLEVPAKLFSLATGWEMGEEDLKHAAQRVLTLERACRVRKGLRRDTLPEKLFEFPVPDGPFKGEKLHHDKFDKMLDEYYDLRGWDKNGVPKEETFTKFDLSSEGERFRQDMGEEVQKSG
ncbi:MAG: hypothetical protein JRC92_01390 [Deltaproteobacteria bacterium]|nr:hypothetical protein [Deltaproteobacteria bacterium]